MNETITNVNYACEIGSDSFQWISHHLDAPDAWAYRVLKKTELGVKFRKAQLSRQSQVMRAVTRCAVGWNWQVLLGYGHRWNIILMALSPILLSIFFHIMEIWFNSVWQMDIRFVETVGAPVTQDWKRHGHQSSWKQQYKVSISCDTGTSVAWFPLPIPRHALCKP